MKKRTKKVKKVKEPSMLRKIIAVYYEQHLAKKAERYLTKQVWSIDFLTKLLQRAANASKMEMQMTITDKQGVTLNVQALPVSSKQVVDDDIFNHLDDDLAVDAFINKHTRS